MNTLPDGVKLERVDRGDVDSHGRRVYKVFVDGQFVGHIERHASQSWRTTGPRHVRTTMIGYARYWTAQLHFEWARQLGHEHEPYVHLSRADDGLIYNARTHGVGEKTRQRAIEALVKAVRA